MSKPLKIAIFGPTCTKKWSVWATPQMKNFFLEISKVDDKLSKTFYFIKTYVLTELLIFFYFMCCFLPKTSFMAAKSGKFNV